MIPHKPSRFMLGFAHTYTYAGCFHKSEIFALTRFSVQVADFFAFRRIFGLVSEKQKPFSAHHPFYFRNFEGLHAMKGFCSVNLLINCYFHTDSTVILLGERSTQFLPHVDGDLVQQGSRLQTCSLRPSFWGIRWEKRFLFWPPVRKRLQPPPPPPQT